MIYAFFRGCATAHVVKNNDTYGFETLCGRTGVPAPFFLENKGDLKLCKRCEESLAKEEFNEEPSLLSSTQLNAMYMDSARLKYLKEEGIFDTVCPGWPQEETGELAEIIDRIARKHGEAIKLVIGKFIKEVLWNE